KAPVGPVSNAASTAAAINETVIGTTTYDLQSNAGMQRRLIRHANGEMSAVWTWSPNLDATWATRGTGYNFFDGTNWGANPTAAIESIRTGWPSISILNGTDEVVFAHDPAADVLVRNSRSGIGSGAWNQAVFNNLDVQLWNKVATGGPGDNTLHVIGLTAPTGGTAMGTLYQGLDGALLYNRSFDNGATWNIQNLLLPGIDTFNFVGLSADAYSIDARGNTIAVVQGAVATGVQLWKSTDNGSTWTMTDVLPQDVPKFDETVDFVDGTIAAAMRSSGGSVHVLLDNNDKAHVFYGNMLIANPTVNDGNLTFFPGTNGIMYWNEDFGKLDPVAISGATDQDGDGTLNSIVALASYGFKGLSSYPTAGIDANGDVYVVFSAIREDLDNSIQTYRHIFGITTADDGCSWSEAVDLTGSAINDFSECVFPSMARRVDNQVHLVYQKDFEPGIAVNGDMDATTNNDIVYLEADLTDFSSTLGACPTGIAGDTLFCAGGGATQTLEAICGTAWNWSTGETTQSISVNTTGVFVVTTTTPCGTVTDTLVVVAPGVGPNVTIQPSANELCPGDAGTLTASVNVAGTNFLWSTGATSATTNINAPGTYTVTATNCGGSTVSSITITQPTGPPAAVINGPISICTGQTITLSAQIVTGGSYLWSTGDVTNTTSVSAAGTYTVTVTNCGGTSTATTTVTTETLPTAQVTAQGGVLTACEGDNVTLIASGGASYVWSNGDTSATIVLNDPA
ncbi:MAG: hypothetical protein AAGB22_06455, partial [Bacteroidota bacterium]